jgi:hypothetical protein
VTANLLKFDTNRARLGMRSLALKVIMRMGNAKNISYWKSLPSSDPKRITLTEIMGALGGQDVLWKDHDKDACERIIHMNLIALFAVHSGQYNDKDILKLCMQSQAAAEKVKSRLQQEEAQHLLG